MHEVLVNRLGGLSLPRKSVVRLTDRPDMTLDVYRGRKTTIQQYNDSIVILFHLGLFPCAVVVMGKSSPVRSSYCLTILLLSTSSSFSFHPFTLPCRACPCKDGWMDGLRFYALFNIISVISGQQEVDNERLCAMKLCLRLRRF